MSIIAEIADLSYAKEIRAGIEIELAAALQGRSHRPDQRAGPKRCATGRKSLLERRRR